MSDAEQIPEARPAEPADAVRAEVEREYSGRLTRAELRAYAAESGITVPDGYADYLDLSKLVGEDGKPSAEAMGEALAPFGPGRSAFPHLAGAQHNRGGLPFSERRSLSLDVRKR
ncbi:hypothetical protein ABZX40_12440 [Streptomyces sp. NPDC004610]|uniref:hypothetical protein n=1 Tax=unclassified Streptomyces TaxID=2593676 RepID=UPI0033A723CA